MYIQIKLNKQNSPYCNCLFFTASAFSRQMQRMADEEFSETGLSPSHAFVLMTVNSRKEVQPGEIAQELFLAPSTVTRLIDKLERLQLVQKKSDGKYMRIASTSKGMERDMRLRKAWENLYSRYNKLFGQSFSNKLTESLHEANVKSNQ